MVHINTGITDTHRITYLQNSVSGKAKQSKRKAKSLSRTPVTQRIMKQL